MGANPGPFAAAALAAILLAPGCANVPDRPVVPSEIPLSTPAETWAAFRDALRAEATLYRAYFCLSRDTKARYPWWAFKTAFTSDDIGTRFRGMILESELVSAREIPPAREGGPPRALVTLRCRGEQITFPLVRETVTWDEQDPSTGVWSERALEQWKADVDLDLYESDLVRIFHVGEPICLFGDLLAPRRRPGRGR